MIRTDRPVSVRSSTRKKTGEFLKDGFNRKLDVEDDFVHRFPSGIPTLAESYAEHRVEIHIHVSLASGQYCAVFYRPLVDKKLGHSFGVRSNQSRGFKRGDNEVEMPVLLNVSKTIEQEKKTVRTVGITSVVRLQPFYRCLDSREHSGHLGLDRLGVEDRPSITDGESGTSSRLSAADRNQLPSKMIENAPEIEQRVSETQGNRGGRRVHLPPDAPSVIKSFSVEIINNYARLRPSEGHQIVAERIELLVCPYQLGLKAKHCRDEARANRERSTQTKNR